jgi:hypothetical protein
MTCFDPKRFANLRGDFYDVDDDDIGESDRGDYDHVSSYNIGVGKATYQPDRPWFSSPYISDSEHGDLVYISNYQVLLEMCVEADKDEDEVPDDCRPFFFVSRDMIYLHAERTPDDIAEALDGLDRYPLLDEDHHTNLEMEGEQEAWDDWAKSDYVHALEKAFESELDSIADDYEIEFDVYGKPIDTEVDLANVEEGDLASHFYHWAEAAGEYWETEGTSRHINVDAIAEAAAEGLRKEEGAIPKGWELPDWVPTEARPFYEHPNQLVKAPYVPPPEPYGGPAPLTKQEESLIGWMMHQKWYTDRADAIQHIYRMRDSFKRGRTPSVLNGLDALKTVQRPSLLSLPSWSR